MKKLFKNEMLLNLLWMFFGFYAGYQYYEKQDYLASGLLISIGIVYLYRFIKTLI